MALILSAFSAQTKKDIAGSLPAPICERRRELLPLILDDWGRNELRRHLSLDSRAMIRLRIQRVDRVRRCANELCLALNAAGDERTIIEAEMFQGVDGRRLENISRSEWADLTRRFAEEIIFLTKLAAVDPKRISRLGPGHPRNYAAYLVLCDAASIFRWYTGKKAARGVHRSCGTETGPFFRLASALWPVVFGRGIRGLPAAMKNWASSSSPLVANINERHPAWRVYADSGPNNPLCD